MTGLYRPAAELARGAWTCDLGPGEAGWSYSGLRVLDLPAGDAHSFDTGSDEVLVLPLRGSCAVRFEEQEATLAGRDSVWSGPSDFAYLPVRGRATVSSVDGGRFALPSARATRPLPFRSVDVAKVPVELRGAGPCSRQMHNFCTPDAFEADRLIACEVLTPGGNWSSYPPHKHDEERPGEEVALEEIYFFEVRGGGVGYQRVYASSPDKPIDVCAEVRGGDAVLLPHGYHGPSMAAPGYDLYYLNVMAGPGEERAWRFTDDPAHAWIRASWDGQEIDPRLPMTSARRPA